MENGGMEKEKKKAQEGDIEEQCKMEKKKNDEKTPGIKLYARQFSLTSLTM